VFGRKDVQLVVPADDKSIATLSLERNPELHGPGAWNLEPGGWAASPNPTSHIAFRRAFNR